MTEQVETPVEEKQEEATKTPGSKFWDWCHVGPGASECEEREKGTCHDPLHFHAYCRLPNQIQVQEIREHAQAARARRIRMLNDPETDVHTILEADLYELERQGNREALIEEIVAKNWYRDHMEAMAVVQEREEFEHIERDQEKFRELDQLPPEKRNKDEWEHLSRHIALFGEELDKQRDSIQKPQKEALADKPIGQLVTLIRTDRINAEAEVIGMQEFSVWQWYHGTLKPVEEGRPKERAFESIEQMKAEDDAIIRALDETFRGLEREANPGNS